MGNLPRLLRYPTILEIEKKRGNQQGPSKTIEKAKAGTGISKKELSIYFAQLGLTRMDFARKSSISHSDGSPTAIASDFYLNPKPSKLITSTDW